MRAWWPGCPGSVWRGSGKGPPKASGKEPPRGGMVRDHRGNTQPSGKPGRGYPQPSPTPRPAPQHPPAKTQPSPAPGGSLVWPHLLPLLPRQMPPCPRAFTLTVLSSQGTASSKETLHGPPLSTEPFLITLSAPLQCENVVCQRLLPTCPAQTVGTRKTHLAPSHIKTLGHQLLYRPSSHHTLSGQWD